MAMSTTVSLPGNCLTNMVMTMHSYGSKEDSWKTSQRKPTQS